MILVSACLAGIPCRWNSENKSNNAIIKLVKEGKAIPVCPEQLGGLSTPREPSEIKNNIVVDKNGNDITSKFKIGAKIVLKIALLYDCRKAILKSKSPSCGKGNIYDGSFSGKIVKGNGITADLLLLNGIQVITEEDI